MDSHFYLEYLEGKGYVYRSADSTDKRALLFRLTEKGQTFRDQTYKTINEVERKWTKKLGKAKMETLKALLTELGNIIIIAEHGYL